MSHEAYEKRVQNQVGEYHEIQSYENRLDADLKTDQSGGTTALGKSATEQRKRMVNTIGCRYIRYVGIYKVLDEACDQIVQPQKLQILRKLLDAVIGRILELKEALVEVDSSDYHFFDELLLDTKLTPQDIALSTPRPTIDPYRAEDSAHKQIKTKITQNPDLNYNYSQRYIGSSIIPIDGNKMTFMEAITLLQGAERGRQGRMRFSLMKEMVNSDAFRLHCDKQDSNGKTLARYNAATVFQKIWRMKNALKSCNLERSLEIEFINMVLSKGENDHSKEMEITMEKIKNARINTRICHERDLFNAFSELQQQVQENEEANMRSYISDTIREWYLEEYEHTGKLPEIPETGTQFLFVEKSETPATPGEETKASKKTSDFDEDDGKFKIPTSKFTGTIEDNFKTYTDWDNFVAKENEKEQAILTRNDTSHNQSHRPKSHASSSRPSSGSSTDSSTLSEHQDPTDINVRASTPDGELPRQDVTQNYQKCVVRNKLRGDIEERVRAEIEETMKQELDALRLVLDKKSKKKGKGKKDKKKKKDKTKKEKDPTGGQPLDKMQDDLVANGIMTLAPEMTYSDLIGNHQLLGSHASTDELVPACLNDLKSLLALYATMPLRSTEVTEKMPDRVRSILLVGPPGSGKRSLAYATAHELRATFFDLSCDNLVGKYVGPDSTGQYWVNPLPPAKKHQEQLMYKVFKMAKEHPPAVIYINEADTMFYKKVPKEIADSEPKRLKKDWPKIIKKFPTGDRIIVIGTATQPFSADQKGLCKVWDKVLIVPRPDYGARIEVFRQAIENYQAEDTKTGLASDNTRTHVGHVNRHTQVDLAALARVSVGFTAGQIIAVVRETLRTLKSVLATRTLIAADFLTNMSKIEAVTEEDEDELATWYYKTPLGKRFQQLQKEKVEEDPKKGKK